MRIEYKVGRSLHGRSEGSAKLTKTEVFHTSYHLRTVKLHGVRWGNYEGSCAAANGAMVTDTRHTNRHAFVPVLTSDPFFYTHYKSVPLKHGYPYGTFLPFLVSYSNEGR